MSVDCFLDTNILFYRYSKQDEQKRLIAANLLESKRVMVSAQVLNEFCNVTRRKFPETYLAIDATLVEILSLLPVVSLDEADTRNAVRVSQRYSFSFYDALILAVAERHGCKVVLSEDMQHGMILDSGMQIINPFVLV